MNRKYAGLAAIFSMSAFIGLAQKPQADSVSSKEMDEVVVTATRTERKLSNVAVPVTIISKKIIQQSGSLRLNDILAEQAGLFITNSSGAGVQMQGLNPDYTLILIDGEPIIGRNSGVLDLSRITVSNIKKIEIVKGPSSSLYGSEALAGVINIITERPTATTVGGSVRYGTFNRTDINANAGFVKDKFNGLVQANRYSSDGYRLANSAGQTQDPFSNYTFNFKGGYRFNPKTNWMLSARYFTEDQHTKPYTQADGAGTVNVSGDAKATDVNINNTVEHKFSTKASSVLRAYYTSYKAVMDQRFLYSSSQGLVNFYDFFQQEFLRLENQTDLSLQKNMDLTMGGGWIFDNVRSNRYDASVVTRRNNIGYLFSQYEWRPAESWNVIAGLRFDHNQQYESRLSPKLAVQKRFGKKLRLNASVGGGFKAPDFRQLYLNFNNPAVGYTVFGNTEVRAGVARLQQQGQLQSILIDPNSIDPLRPETSVGINVGAHYTFTPKLWLTANFFRNDIEDLIVTNSVAQKTNNQFVFSYFNVKRALTQGVESEITWKAISNVTVQAGYQFLYTADKDQLDKIKEGNEFGRINGDVYRLSKSDYKGLFNRSQHMGNVKIYYENKKGWFGNVRTTYRSGWGVTDTDGNLYLNRGDQFSSDYIQANMSVGKTFKQGFKLQAGCDNIFNYTDVQFLPEVPGRTAFVTLAYSFTHSPKK